MLSLNDNTYVLLKIYKNISAMSQKDFQRRNLNIIISQYNVANVIDLRMYHKPTITKK